MRYMAVYKQTVHVILNIYRERDVGGGGTAGRTIRATGTWGEALYKRALSEKGNWRVSMKKQFDLPRWHIEGS
jgi:hypothetical protein